MLTRLTPPARTSSPPRGSPTTPGRTRPVPPRHLALLSVPALLLQRSLWSLWLQQSSQWSLPMFMLSPSTTLSTLSTPPTQSPSLTPTLWLPPLFDLWRLWDLPSRKYSELTEVTIRSPSGSQDRVMLPARLTCQD